MPPSAHSTFLATIVITGFIVAFFHAAIPTHWLPFVLVSRARGWSRAKTLGVTLFAGLGHVLITTLLGFAIAWLGLALDNKFQKTFPWIIGGVLMLVGAFFLWRQSRGKGVCHHHVPETAHKPSEHCGHEDADEHAHSHWESELGESALVTTRKSDWAVIAALFMMLTLSPCEGFLPVYLSGVQFGWRGFLLLSAILAIGALAGMLLFTYLTLTGLQRANLKKLERWEAGLLGALFIVIGALFIVIESLGG